MNILVIGGAGFIGCNVAEHHAIDAYLSRQKVRLGAPKLITATAHKLARLIYSMLQHGTQYVDAGQDYYEQRYRTRVVENLKRRAFELGFELVKTPLPCPKTCNE